MFKKILVPVDGSDKSIEALKLAVDLQNIHNSELLILTVYRHHSLLEASMSMVRGDSNPEVMDNIMREHASSVAESCKTSAKEFGSTNVRAFVKNGPPARTIVKFAKSKEADLIVLGSRGQGDLEDFLLGSVSHKVTGLATCPVLVV